jgi:hypothetical protein
MSTWLSFQMSALAEGRVKNAHGVYSGGLMNFMQVTCSLYNAHEQLVVNRLAEELDPRYTSAYEQPTSHDSRRPKR